MTLPQKSTESFVKFKLSRRWRVRSRLVLSILVAFIVSVLIPSWVNLSTRILCIWNGGTICFLILTWLLMVKALPKTMRRNAQSQDEGRFVILGLITAAACASILAIAFILRETKGKGMDVVIPHLFLAAITIIGSWLLVHTIFAMHYAHEYYQDHETDSNSKAGGLDFLKILSQTTGIFYISLL